MRTIALLGLGCWACVSNTQVTLRAASEPDCAAKRHEMLAQASTIADAEERGRFLSTVPDCSEREWQEDRPGGCDEQSATRDAVIVSCHEEQRMSGIGAFALGMGAIGVSLMALAVDQAGPNVHVFW